VAICALESKPAAAQVVLDKENHEGGEENGNSETEEEFPHKFRLLEHFFSDLSSDYGRLNVFEKVSKHAPKTSTEEKAFLLGIDKASGEVAIYAVFADNGVGGGGANSGTATSMPLFIFVSSTQLP
jgi:hypothetical protein